MYFKYITWKVNLCSGKRKGKVTPENIELNREEERTIRGRRR